MPQYSLLDEINAADETNKGVEADLEVSGGNLGLFVPVGHFSIMGCDGDQVRLFGLWANFKICTFEASHNLLPLNRSTSVARRNGPHIVYKWPKESYTCTPSTVIPIALSENSISAVRYFLAT